MSTEGTIRGKTIGEMNAQEFDAACYAVTGLRPPRNPEQDAAYIVATAALTASGAVADQDLRDAWLIDFLLGRPNPLPGARPLIEKAIGRPVVPGEPKPFDAAALRREQSRRDQRRERALFD